MPELDEIIEEVYHIYSCCCEYFMDNVLAFTVYERISARLEKPSLLQDQKAKEKATSYVEPPPKLLEHIANKEVALDVAPSQLVEGKPEVRLSLSYS